MAFYDTCIRIFAGFFRSVYRIEVIGEENLPPEDCAFLVCSNHGSAVDPIVVGAALKRKIHYLAKEELFHIPLLNLLIRAFGTIPIKRGAGDVGALKAVIRALGENKTVGVFPQGHRYPGVSPRTTQARSGIGMILLRTGVPAVPVCVETRAKKVHLFRKTRVIIGSPVRAESIPLPAPREEMVHSELYQTVADGVFSEICALGEAHSFDVKNV